MIETVIVIVAAIPVPNQDTAVVSFYINQHSQDIRCVPNIQEIVKTHGAIEWIKIQGIAKETWTAITNRYLSTQLGPKS
jgi:hypothetical protein